MPREWHEHAFACRFVSGHGPASGSRRAHASASESKIRRIGRARKGQARDRDDAMCEAMRETERYGEKEREAQRILCNQ